LRGLFNFKKMITVKQFRERLAHIQSQTTLSDSDFGDLPICLEGADYGSPNFPLGSMKLSAGTKFEVNEDVGVDTLWLSLSIRDHSISNLL